MSALAISTIVAASALLCAVGFLAVGDYRLVVRLRENHRHTWEKLGSPSPWFNRFEDVASVHAFVFGREHQSLGDATLSELAERLRILTYTVYALAAATLVLMVLTRLSK